MKILFTGGSSFTGYWFIKELAAAGHDITAVFRRKPEDYTDDLRRKRIDTLSSKCRQVFCSSFGDDKFLELIKEQSPDVLCCHGAEVTNYNKPEFDAIRAAANNTNRLPNVLNALADAGSNKVLLTGSVFRKRRRGRFERTSRLLPLRPVKGIYLAALSLSRADQIDDVGEVCNS